jgi:hypothetical protein
LAAFHFYYRGFGGIVADAWRLWPAKSWDFACEWLLRDDVGSGLELLFNLVNNVDTLFKSIGH